MAELMKSGLKEQEQKKDGLKASTRRKGGNEKREETTVVFTTYDTANEMGQGLVMTPQEYEMPVTSSKPVAAGTLPKNQNVVLASYDVAKDSTGEDLSKQGRLEFGIEYYTVQEHQLRPKITGNHDTEDEYEQF